MLDTQPIRQQRLLTSYTDVYLISIQNDKRLLLNETDEKKVPVFIDKLR